MENSRAVQKQQGLKPLTLSLRNITNVLGESVHNGDRYTRTRDWVNKQCENEYIKIRSVNETQPRVQKTSKAAEYSWKSIGDGRFSEKFNVIVPNVRVLTKPQLTNNNNNNNNNCPTGHSEKRSVGRFRVPA